MSNILHGKYHLDIAIANQKVGDLYSDKECFKEALPYLKTALRAHMSNHNISPEISSLLYKIGRVYYETDEFSGALKYFTSSLNMDKQMYGDTHGGLAHTYLLLGQIHLTTSRLDEAIGHLSQALALLSFTNPNHYEDLSSILLRIGIAYMKQHDYPSAEHVYTQRLSLQKTMYGDIENTYIAETFKQLATIHMSRKHFQQALHSYLHLLHIQRKLLGKEHYKIASLLIQIGDIYNYHLSYESSRAITVYQEALRILQLRCENEERILSLQKKIASVYEYSSERNFDGDGDGHCYRWDQEFSIHSLGN